MKIGFAGFYRSNNHWIQAFIMLLFLPFPSLVFAGCGGGLTGKAGEYDFYIGTGDCQYEQDMLIVTNSKQSASSSHTFAPDCAFVYGSFMATEFSCKAATKSPLVGTKYIFKEDAKRSGSCGKPPYYYYACVQNCSEKVPATFDMEPVECDEGP